VEWEDALLQNPQPAARQSLVDDPMAPPHTCAVDLEEQAAEMVEARRDAVHCAQTALTPYPRHLLQTKIRERLLCLIQLLREANPLFHRLPSHICRQPRLRQQLLLNFIHTHHLLREPIELRHHPIPTIDIIALLVRHHLQEKLGLRRRLRWGRRSGNRCGNARKGSHAEDA
jgi:hypothetical protein